jgi:hypothetical protein
MKPAEPITIETFAAVLAANGYAPDSAKLQVLYAALPSIMALQQRVRAAAPMAESDMSAEPAHVFRVPMAGSEGDK